MAKLEACLPTNTKFQRSWSSYSPPTRQGTKLTANYNFLRDQKRRNAVREQELDGTRNAQSSIITNNEAVAQQAVFLQLREAGPQTELYEVICAGSFSEPRHLFLIITLTIALSSMATLDPVAVLTHLEERAQTLSTLALRLDKLAWTNAEAAQTNAVLTLQLDELRQKDNESHKRAEDLGKRMKTLEMKEGVRYWLASGNGCNRKRWPKNEAAEVERLFSDYCNNLIWDTLQNCIATLTKLENGGMKIAMNIEDSAMKIEDGVMKIEDSAMSIEDSVMLNFWKRLNERVDELERRVSMLELPGPSYRISTATASYKAELVGVSLGQSYSSWPRMRLDSQLVLFWNLEEGLSGPLHAAGVSWQDSAATLTKSKDDPMN
ncbi:hypothetical protein BDP27DRAFT_1365138 [Rhodocollybia butyracea]|uniref:Uncharacterized protein n=1 Tax=Rhodocollybia butyracea TaxID=206335 RepID=A0A9P5PNK0_9AGAR|nr:hypothetical protein BDP27DRAFT_1365138 [Rhodocollybia butyracea]